MEAKFDTIINRSILLLEKEGIDSALSAVQKFFEQNQPDIKAYFDSKSLEETAAEMKKRLHDIEKEIRKNSSQISSQTANAFVRLLSEFFQNEYDCRVQDGHIN